jgi:hypothetical protein
MIFLWYPSSSSPLVCAPRQQRQGWSCWLTHHSQQVRQSETPCGKTESSLFLKFSYVCPEPVLANARVLSRINGAQERHMSAPHAVHGEVACTLGSVVFRDEHLNGNVQKRLQGQGTKREKKVEAVCAPEEGGEGTQNSNRVAQSSFRSA